MHIRLILNQFRENTQVLEYLLSSLLTFCKSVAIDCRGQLCQFGEEIVPSLLQIWSKRHPSIKVLDQFKLALLCLSRVKDMCRRATSL
jgi:hypothetical protein